MIWNVKFEFLKRFIDAIQPICLPTTEDVRSMNLAGRMSYVIGWGETSFRKYFI